MENFSTVDLTTISGWLVFLAYILWREIPYFRRFVGRAYGDKVEDFRDRREYEQSLEAQEQNYRLLQASWREDKIASLLEDEVQFNRERIFEEIKALVPVSRQVENLREQIRLLSINVSKLTEKVNRLIPDD